MSSLPADAALRLFPLLVVVFLAGGAAGCDGTIAVITDGPDASAAVEQDAGDVGGGPAADAGRDGGADDADDAGSDAGDGGDAGTGDGGVTPDAGSSDAGTDAGTGDGGLSEWPDDTNTGVPPGTILTPGGSLRVKQQGQVVDGVDISGSITVEANDVVIRRSRVTGGGANSAAIRLADGFRNLTVEDVTVIGTNVVDSSKGIVASGDITVRRVDLSGVPEGITLFGAGGLIEDNYFHDLPALIGGDGIEVWQGKGLVIRHNNIQRRDGNSVIKLPLDIPGPGGDDVTIDNNLLAGGGWTVYGAHEPGAPNSWTNVRITNNRFSVRFHPRCGVYGPIAYENSALSSGNVWHESGKPLSQPAPPQP